MAKLVKVGIHGHAALVDDTDYELVAQYTWSLQPSHKGVHYARREWVANGKRHTQYMHNLILGVIGVDHMDHDGLNNQRSNLRIATPAQNCRNARPRVGTSSPITGVSWYPRYQKWVAYINLDGRRKFLGYFDTEESAIEVRLAAQRELFGEFAVVT